MDYVSLIKKMNNAVIFGGCGFIGLYLAEELTNLNKYERIYLVDIQEPRDIFCNSKYLDLLKSKKIFFINADVRNNLNNIDIKDSVSLIVNLAAIHKEPGHLPDEYFDTNVNGAKNICNFADKFNCKNIIFTSSIAVYGVGDHEKNEGTEPQPSTPYGKSKFEAEKIHMNWQKENDAGLILSICRPGVVFGAGEKGNVTRLVKFIKKRLFFYMGNEKLKKGGIYIKELTNVLIWTNNNQSDNKFANLAVFNACMHPCPTLENFAKSISNQYNYSGRFISLPKIIIKFFLFLSFMFTKIFKKNNSLNYYRLIKLFKSNTIVPNYLIQNEYIFKYNLDTSFNDWKKTNQSDW